MQRRGLVHGLAWTLATGAAVTLSWWGVHTVMSGTAYDRPRALPITAAEPQAASTHRPRETPEPGGGAGSPSKPSSPSNSSAPDEAPSSAKPQPKPKPSGDQGGGAPAGDVKSYTVAGGRVAFEMGPSSAELVSATPDAGWQMQVWKQEQWIRVTFTQGDREISVFCTWHDHAPRVETDER
ncbi:hypothetical protein [Streptomyces sp. Da 82-17]|uniref:hypothetical protein n=1 Tax=Streptomyces sp. Da 82-17 TaxID=3377116 RepID=UPI0038D3F27C